MPSAVLNGTLNRSEGNASIMATVRAQPSRWSKPQPAANPTKGFGIRTEAVKLNSECGNAGLAGCAAWLKMILDTRYKATPSGYRGRIEPARRFRAAEHAPERGWVADIQHPPGGFFSAPAAKTLIRP